MASSSSEERFERIKTSLKDISSYGRISVMPDYFVDRFVRISSIEELTNAVKKKAFEGGGGSIRGIIQQEVKGGNAVNLSYALGLFGAEVNLIALADSFPAESLKATFQSIPNVKLLIVSSKAGFTIAFEFQQDARQVNVMVSDVGELENFDGSRLVKPHWDAIAESKIVAVLNWASNKKGNELCERVYSFSKSNSAMTFFDPADISELSHLLPEFKQKVLNRGLVDVMSFNDNEARIVSRILCDYSLPHDYEESELKKAVKLISEMSGSRVDIHTRNISLSCAEKECCVQPCHKVVQKTVTGAGDVWDAVDIVGYLVHLNAEDRLAFANAAAGLYVSRESASQPRPDEVLAFMKTSNDFHRS